MRPQHSCLAMSLSFLLATACAGGPDSQDIDFPVMPAPTGETAPANLERNEPVAVEPESDEPVLLSSAPITHQWTDRFARRWHASFRVVCATSESHEALAEACLQVNWVQATSTGRMLLEQVDLTDTDEVSRWTDQLRQDLDALLFPCTTGMQVGTVVGIEWISRRTR